MTVTFEKALKEILALDSNGMVTEAQAIARAALSPSPLIQEVWDFYQEARASRGLKKAKLPSDTGNISGRIREHGPSLVKDVLAFTVKDAGDLQWLNSITPFRRTNFERNLGRMRAQQTASEDEWMVDPLLAHREVSMACKGDIPPWLEDKRRQRMSHDSGGNELMTPERLAKIAEANR